MEIDKLIYGKESYRIIGACMAVHRSSQCLLIYFFIISVIPKNDSINTCKRAESLVCYNKNDSRNQDTL